MQARRSKRIVMLFVACVMLVTLGNWTASAADISSAAREAMAPASADEYLSKEIVISELDNSKYSPAVAYNSVHNQYLVVWENVWGAGGHHDIYAQRLSSTGQLASMRWPEAGLRLHFAA